MPQASNDQPQENLVLRVPTDLKAAFEAATASAALSADQVLQDLMRVYVEEHPQPEPDHDDWFRAEVQAALDDGRPGIPHDQVMRKARSLLDRIAAEKLARET